MPSYFAVDVAGAAFFDTVADPDADATAVVVDMRKEEAADDACLDSNRLRSAWRRARRLIYDCDGDKAHCMCCLARTAPCARRAAARKAHNAALEWPARLPCRPAASPGRPTAVACCFRPGSLSQWRVCRPRGSLPE